MDLISYSLKHTRCEDRILLGKQDCLAKVLVKIENNDWKSCLLTSFISNKDVTLCSNLFTSATGLNNPA